jgi:hypothetical protein
MAAGIVVAATGGGVEAKSKRRIPLRIISSRSDDFTRIGPAGSDWRSHRKVKTSKATT